MFCGVRGIKHLGMCCSRKIISLGVVTVLHHCVFVVAVFGEEKFKFKIMTDPVDLMKLVQHLRDSNRKVGAARGGDFSSVTFKTGTQAPFLLHLL